MIDHRDLFPNCFSWRPILSCILLGMVTAQATPPPPAPVQEFRGVWVASVYNIDWPSKPGLPSEVQQAEMVKLLDTAVKLRLNAIFLQVRPAGDALYQSTLEPWSPWLTGEMGRPPSPAYDPLAFAIQQAHQRGIQLHAWFNPFRALSSADKFKVSPTHLSRQQPQWMRRYAGNLWMDPGVEGVRRHAIAVMADVAKRYAVDGIHIDDYFYPYPVNGEPFDDAKTYASYIAAGGELPLLDWRRQNMNDFIRDLYTTLKAIRPTLAFGISPFGYWRPTVPEGIRGQLDPFDSLAADVRLWLHQGWLDYLVPQLYWPIQPPELSFSTLYEWWLSENPQQRNIYAGIAIDRIGKDRDAAEILKQVQVTRAVPTRSAPGQVYWNWRALSSNRDKVANRLLAERYVTHAIVPPYRPLPMNLLVAPEVRVTDGTVSWSLPPPASLSQVRFWYVHSHDGKRWLTHPALPRSQMSFTIPKGIRAISVQALGQDNHPGPTTMIEVSSPN
jgi:uncharacterized lipoprotein YddW (UPF0748 family)